MPKTLDATGERIAARDSAPGESALLDVQAVARMLCCSSRTVHRLSDSGRMPRPLKVATLVRWRRDAVEQWVAEGCPSCRGKAVRP